MTIASLFPELLTQYIMTEANLILVALDRNGIVLEANAFTKALLNEDPVNRPFRDIIVDFHGTFSIQEMVGNDNWPVLLNITGKSDLPQSFYFHFYAQGDHTIAIGQTDADELEAMRGSLLNLNNELGNLTRQLQKKNVQLEQLDAQKNQFFGMAAHDLRHPIGVIKMYSEFIADEAADRLDEEHLEFLSYVRQSGELLEHILDDFLDISVFESGRLNLEREVVDIAAWLSSIVEYNETLATRKDITVVYSPPDPRNKEVTRRTVDRSKMGQVVNNLISNALKYCRPGDKVEVRLQLEPEETVIQVQDNGPGIDEKDQDRLFLPFERLKGRNRTSEKSSGLGLAIVKKIIEAHGGRVWVESQVDIGSTFSVAWPDAEISET